MGSIRTERARKHTGECRSQVEMQQHARPGQVAALPGGTDFVVRRIYPARLGAVRMDDESADAPSGH